MKTVPRRSRNRSIEKCLPPIERDNGYEINPPKRVIESTQPQGIFSRSQILGNPRRPHSVRDGIGLRPIRAGTSPAPTFWLSTEFQCREDTGPAVKSANVL